MNDNFFIFFFSPGVAKESAAQPPAIAMETGAVASLASAPDERPLVAGSTDCPPRSGAATGEAARRRITIDFTQSSDLSPRYEKVSVIKCIASSPMKSCPSLEDKTVPDDADVVLEVSANEDLHLEDSLPELIHASRVHRPSQHLQHGGSAELAWPTRIVEQLYPYSSPDPDDNPDEDVAGCSWPAEGQHSQPSPLDGLHSRAHCHTNTTQRVCVPQEASPLPTHHHVLSQSPGMDWVTHADQQRSFVFHDMESGRMRMAVARDESVFCHNPSPSPPPLSNTFRFSSLSAPDY